MENSIHKLPSNHGLKEDINLKGIKKRMINSLKCLIDAQLFSQLKKIILLHSFDCPQIESKIFFSKFSLVSPTKY